MLSAMYSSQYPHPPSDEMDLFEKLFRHFSEHKVIVCKQCRFGVIPSQVESHVRNWHASVTKQERQGIIDIVGTLPDLARNPEDVQYPSIKSPPIPELPIISDALRCVKETPSGICGHTCQTTKAMADHCC